MQQRKLYSLFEATRNASDLNYSSTYLQDASGDPFWIINVDAYHT